MPERIRALERELRSLRHAYRTAEALERRRTLALEQTQESLESGLLRIEPVDFDLYHAIQGAVRQLEPRAVEQGTLLSCAFGGEVPRRVTADRTRVTQVVANLMANAVKFTHDGHIDVAVRALRPQIIEIAVRDTGPGIHPERLSRIFEVGPRAGAWSLPTDDQTGLGLAVCRRLAQMMGGDLTVTSEVGRGSCFTFRFLVLDTSNRRVQVSEATSESERIAQLYVLVVDDSAVSRKIAARMLRRAGISCEVVPNGAEAVELVKQRAYDLVLMDCEMPVMDGYEATWQILSDPDVTQKPTVVALTANADDAHRQRCLDLGMADYLSKPVSYPLLLGMLKKVVGNAYASSE